MPAPQLPLNTFGNTTVELSTTTQVLYTAPIGITAIILGAQASNISNASASIRFTITKSAVDYILLKDFTIPVNDAAEITTGKMVLAQGDTLTAYASANASINVSISYLETSNE